MNTMNWPNIKEIRNGKYVNEEIYRCLQNLQCPKKQHFIILSDCIYNKKKKKK